MKSKLCVLVLVVVLVVVAAVPIAAAPLANPCAPGAAYNPTCDVNQDGAVNVLDVQLTAGHWNQTGTFTSDNNHNHLGQTWTGSNNPLKIQGAFGAPDYAALVLNNTTGHGLAVTSAAIDGIYVGSVGAYGMVVNHADQDGVYVGTAGSPSSSQASPASNGFEVAGAQDSGLYVGRADSYGVYVASAGVSGMTVHNTPTGYLADATASRGFLSINSGGVGLGVSSSGTYGVYVQDAGSDGVEVWSAAGNGVNADGNLYGGYFWGDIYVQGNCVGCLQANFAVNVGDRALQAGDVVSVQAVTATDYDTGPALWQVMLAQPGQAVVGVVAGRAELVTDAEHRPSETGKRLVPRDGAAQPGEYVTIVYSGPMQVKVASGESAISAGTRLTAATDGSVRPLQTRMVDGMVVTEGAPVVGVALEAVTDGKVWVLVNPH